MRHKKLDTTQHYLSGIAPKSIDAEFTTKAVELGTPTTIQEIMELSDSGFTKYTEADGYQIFRKPK